MSLLVGAKFGDIIKNKNLREDNPEKYGFMYKENGVLHLTNMRGLYWTIINNPGANLEVMTSIFSDDYRKFLQEEE